MWTKLRNNLTAATALIASERIEGSDEHRTWSGPDENENSLHLDVSEHSGENLLSADLDTLSIATGASVDTCVASIEHGN